MIQTYKVTLAVALILTMGNAFADDNAILTLDYNYSMWKPTGIEGVKYETQGLNAAEVTLDMEPLAKKLAGKMSVPMPFFIPKIKYLFTPGDRADQKELLQNSTTVEGNEALEHLWIELPVAYFNLIGNNPSGIKLKYEKAAFISKLTLKENKSYQAFGETQQNLLSGDTVYHRTDFEKFTAMYEHTENENTTIGFGFYAQQYRKPYSATVDGMAVSNIIVDSKFSSKGFVMLLSSHSPKESEIYFGGKFQMHYGEGDIEFSEEEGINSYLSPYETTALMLINAELETRVSISKSLKLNATLGYDYYDFHKAKKTKNGISSQKYMHDLDLNIDEMIYLKAGMVYTF